MMNNRHYKFNIPKELYDLLNKGDMKVIARLRRGLQLLLLEDNVRKAGGRIIIESAAGERVVFGRS